MWGAESQDRDPAASVIDSSQVTVLCFVASTVDSRAFLGILDRSYDSLTSPCLLTAAGALWYFHLRPLPSWCCRVFGFLWKVNMFKTETRSRRQCPPEPPAVRRARS